MSFQLKAFVLTLLMSVPDSFAEIIETCPTIQAHLNLAGDEKALAILFVILQGRFPSAVDAALKEDFEVGIVLNEYAEGIQAALRALAAVNNILLVRPMPKFSDRDPTDRNLSTLLKEMRDLASKSIAHDIAVQARLAGFLVLYQKDLSSPDRFRLAKTELIAAINTDAHNEYSKNQLMGLNEYEKALEKARPEGGGSRKVSEYLSTHVVVRPINSTAVSVVNKPGGGD